MFIYKKDIFEGIDYEVTDSEELKQKESASGLGEFSQQRFTSYSRANN